VNPGELLPSWIAAAPLETIRKAALDLVTAKYGYLKDLRGVSVDELTEQSQRLGKQNA
jgi:hypothetical protein